MARGVGTKYVVKKGLAEVVADSKVGAPMLMEILCDLIKWLVTSVLFL